MSPYRLLAAACLAATLVPFAAAAESTIKIGFPIPLSGPAAVYGEPISKGAEMAVQELNAKGGVLGRKLDLLERDSKANADEAVRLYRVGARLGNCQLEVVDALGNRRVPPGEETRTHPERDVGQPQVEAGRLDLLGRQRWGGPDDAVRHQRGDHPVRQNALVVDPEGERHGRSAPDNARGIVIARECDPVTPA